MAYTINLTDGAIFATIPDGTVNTNSSMILVGKNYAGYGEFLDENFIHLLENGANNVPPSVPLVGQLWWDKSSNTMKVFNGTTFKIISGATASSTAPTSNVPGDLWWDTANAQLKVWNGSTFTLIGPLSSGPGVSGAIVTTITDNLAVQHVVVQLFVDNTLVGTVSKDATFTPQTAIPGFPQIAPGIQLSTAVPNALFRGTALNANTLETLAASAFMRTGVNTSTSGTLAVINDNGLRVGLDQDARISVTPSTSEVIIDNETPDANLSMRINRAGIATTVMRALGGTAEVTFPATAGVSLTGNITVPQIIKSGTNNIGNVGSSTNVFNTMFATTFQGTATSAANVSGTVFPTNGGTGRNTLNANAVIIGNGVSSVNFVSPGADGNILTAVNGTWVSQGTAPGGVQSVTTTPGGPIQISGQPANPVVGIVSPIPVANGGTGGSSFSSGSVLLGNNTNGFQVVAPGTNGNILTASGGTWVSQAIAAGGVTSVTAAQGSAIQVSGTSQVVVGIANPLPVSNGGTGAQTLGANAVILGNGNNPVTAVSPGNNGNALISNGSTWVSQAIATGGVNSVSAAPGGPITVTGSASSPVVGIQSPIPTANGGTGFSSYSSGELLVGNAVQNNLNKLAAGSTGQVLTVTSPGTLAWQTPTSGGVTSVAAAPNSPITVTGTSTAPVIGITTPITVANGGTGVNTLTSGALLVGNGPGNVQFVAPGANGTVLASTGTAWVSSVLTGLMTSSNQSFTGVKTFTDGIVAGGVRSTNNFYRFDDTNSYINRAVPPGPNVAREIRFYLDNIIQARIGTDTFGAKGVQVLNEGFNRAATIGLDTLNVVTLGVTDFGSGVRNLSFRLNDYYEFADSGDVRKPGGGPFVASSDSRLKTHVRDYEPGLQAIQALKPRQFDLLDRAKKSQLGVDRIALRDCVGLIAQEVQGTELASMVTQDLDGYYAIDTNQVTYALINAIKQLKDEIDDLRSQLQELS